MQYTYYFICFTDNFGTYREICTKYPDRTISFYELLDYSIYEAVAGRQGDYEKGKLIMETVI